MDTTDPFFQQARDSIMACIARSEAEALDRATGWIVTTQCLGAVSLVGPFENVADGLVYAAQYRDEMEREFPDAGWRVDVLPLMPAEPLTDKEDNT